MKYFLTDIGIGRTINYNTSSNLDDIFLEVPLNYQHINALQNINNKTAFIGIRDSKYYLNYDLEEINGYDYIFNLISINDTYLIEAGNGYWDESMCENPKCCGCKDRKWIGERFLIYNGTRVLEGHKFVEKVKGSESFITSKDNKYYIVENMEFKYLGVNNIEQSLILNNSLYYISEVENKKYIYKDNEVLYGPYNKISSFGLFDNSIVFKAYEITNEEPIIYFNNSFNDNYIHMSFLDTRLTNEPFLKLKLKSDNKDNFKDEISCFYYKSKINCLEGDYEILGTLNNKTILDREKGRYSSLVIDGQELKTFDSVREPIIIKNNVYYIAMNYVMKNSKKTKQFYLVENNNILQNLTVDADRIMKIKDSFAIIYDEIGYMGRNYIVLNGKKTAEYSDIKYDSSELFKINNKLILETRRNNDLFLLIEK